MSDNNSSVAVVIKCIGKKNEIIKMLRTAKALSAKTKKNIPYRLISSDKKFNYFQKRQLPFSKLIKNLLIKIIIQ